MVRKAAKASETELEILAVLWKRGPVRIREVAEELYGESGPSVYGTVQSLLERLEAKGLVKRDRSSFAHRFSAKVSRTEFLGKQLKAIADKVCEGSVAPVLLSLVQSVRLTSEERRDLLRLIDRK